MPFVSKRQQRFMESASSPLSAAQKKDWESATNFKTLPERVTRGQKQIATPRNHARKLKHS